MFLGLTGEERGVHVGYGPKRTYGAKIVKIGVGGRTGPYTRPPQSLMFGLLSVEKETLHSAVEGAGLLLLLFLSSLARCAVCIYDCKDRKYSRRLTTIT